MNTINVTSVQTILHWESIDANLQHTQEHLDTIIHQTDIIILPEMFTTGFTMDAASVAELMEGKSMKWMQEQANKFQAVITGSIIIKENDNFYNRLIWMQPDGQYFSYDKRNLFTLAGEHDSYQRGKKKLIVEWKGWKICPLIC